MSTNEKLTVKGYKFSAVPAGLKKNDELDLGLVFSEKPAVCAGVFTTNKVVAAPVQLTAQRIASGLCQAILINSKNANACTGAQGLLDASACSTAVSQGLQIDDSQVAISSTGVIGQRLDVDKITSAIPRLLDQLDSGSAPDVAEAMMTTDSFAKVSAAYGEAAGESYTLLGIAKGAGMIHPNMATMLAFVVTDAAVSRDFLDAALRQAVDASFNRITVDRDTSTNDTVLVLANGAGSAEINDQSADAETFVSLLQQVLLDLAKMIVSDGEGATKLVRIQVKGAASDADALMAAEAVATSNLVKTAFFGEDANWGRIIAAVGYSGAEVDPDSVDIRVGDVLLAENGLAGSPDQEAAATVIMKLPEFTVTIDLKLGDGQAYYYTSDLTYDYVKINADYRT
jgi:glutamate N-acetyltransferase/amino-acid N-acetyltransferase